MVFRLYILFILICFVVLFTPCFIVGACCLFVATILWPFGQTIRYRNWRRSQIDAEKPLAFGIQSIKLQRQNFKAISHVFSRYPMLEKTLKRMSVIFDDMHVEDRNYVWVSVQT